MARAVPETVSGYGETGTDTLQKAQDLLHLIFVVVHHLGRSVEDLCIGLELFHGPDQIESRRIVEICSR